MTKGRVFGGLCLIAGAAMAFLGFTDGALTELKIPSVGPVVLGLIVLAFSRPTPKELLRNVSFTDATLNALGKSHGFDEDELQQNRAGKVHPRQLAEGLSSARGDMIAGRVLLGVGAVIFCAGLALPWFPRALIDQDFKFAVPHDVGVALFVGGLVGGFLSLLPLLFGFVIYRPGARAKRGYQTGRVERVEAPVQKLEVVHRRGGGSSYWFMVGNARLLTRQTAWQTAESGANYAFYVLSGTNILLSMEPL